MSERWRGFLVKSNHVRFDKLSVVGSNGVSSDFQDKKSRQGWAKIKKEADEEKNKSKKSDMRSEKYKENEKLR